MSDTFAEAENNAVISCECELVLACSWS